MALDRVALAESRVPRYTSYPTAAEFTPAIGAADAARWLAAVPAGEPLSLYVHVPFCRRLCLYCGCHTRIVGDSAPLAGYVDRLIAELALVAARLAGGARLGHLAFGGGTPTILAPRLLARLVGAIDRHLPRALGSEFAVEIDPRGLDQPRVEALAELGVTRVNLGVQDLDPAVQRAIGRVQPPERVAAAVEQLVRRGIAAIGCDLIYGLPLQTPATMEATVARVAALGFGRVALCGYAHVPWMKPHQRRLEPHGLPDAPARLALERAAADALAAAGYVRVGLDHFARPDDALARAARAGRLRRNFQGYTTDASTTLIGLGASAISAFRDGFAQNAATVEDWAAAIGHGRLATARGIALDDADRRRARVIERLMCDLAVDLADDVLADPALADDLDALAPLAAEGLVRLDGARLVVPEAGRPFVRVVAAAFDARRRAAPARHAAAV